MHFGRSRSNRSLGTVRGEWETDRSPVVLTRDRLGPTRVGNIDELVQQGLMFLVIPVSKDDCEFFVVGVNFFSGVDYDGGTEAVHVLALRRALVMRKGRGNRGKGRT